jgi:hypothetical protein
MFADAVRASGSPRNTFPCRYIPLTSRGETVNPFYEWGTEEELETALRAWLLRIIALVEQEEQASSQSA